MRDLGIDARMDAEREAVAVGRDVVEQRIELFGTPAHDMQDRPEHLFRQVARAVEAMIAGGT